MSDLTTAIGDVPGVGAPAARALAAEGMHRVGDLAGRDWEQLRPLHGVGPAAGRRLQAVLAAHGASLRNPPAARDHGAVLTRGATGTGAKDLRTHATDVDPARYVDGLAGRRRGEGAALLELFGEAAGERPVMWGPSMIGYGAVHYRYATGREGDTFQIGFSPRKAELALYGLQGFPRTDELLERMGPHRRGAGCVWVRSLAAIDTAVLAELVAHVWAHGPSAAC